MKYYYLTFYVKTDRHDDSPFEIGHPRAASNEISTFLGENDCGYRVVGTIGATGIGSQNDPNQLNKALKEHVKWLKHSYKVQKKCILHSAEPSRLSRFMDSWWSSLLVVPALLLPFLEFCISETAVYGFLPGVIIMLIGAMMLIYSASKGTYTREHFRDVLGFFCVGLISLAFAAAFRFLGDAIIDGCKLLWDIIY